MPNDAALVVLVIDGSAKLANHWERIYAAYVGRILRLLDENVFEKGEVQLATIVFYGSSPYLTRPISISKWQILSKVLPSLPAVLDKTTGKGRAFYHGKEPALLDALVAACETIHKHQSQSPKHVILVTASDIPSNYLSDELDGMPCTTNTLPEYNGLDWSTLEQKMRDMAVKFSLVTTHFLPRIENFQIAGMDDSPALIPVLHIDHALRLCGFQGISRPAKRSNDDSGESFALATNETSAKRPKISHGPAQSNVIDLTTSELDSTPSTFQNTTQLVVPPIEEELAQIAQPQTTAPKAPTKVAIQALLTHLATIIPSLAGKSADEVLTEVTRRAADLTQSTAQEVRNIQTQLANGSTSEAEAKKVLEHLNARVGKQKQYLDNVIQTLKTHTSTETRVTSNVFRPPSRSSSIQSQPTANNPSPQQMAQAQQAQPQTLYSGAIRTTYPDAQGKEKELIGYVTATAVNPYATQELSDAQQSWPAILNIDLVTAVDITNLQKYVASAKIPIVAFNATPLEQLISSRVLNQTQAQGNANMVRHFAQTLHQKKQSAWVKLGEGDGFGMLLMSQNGTSLVAPVFVKAPLPASYFVPASNKTEVPAAPAAARPNYNFDLAALTQQYSQTQQPNPLDQANLAKLMDLYK